MTLQGLFPFNLCLGHLGIENESRRHQTLPPHHVPRSRLGKWSVLPSLSPPLTAHGALGSQWVTLLLRDNPEALFKTKPKAKDKLVSMAGKAPCDLSPYVICHSRPLAMTEQVKLPQAPVNENLVPS